MDRILRDAGGGTITLLTYDTAGALADVDETNAPTVTVTDSAGTTVGGFTPSRVTTGSYQATLPSNFEVLDTYDVLWTWAGNGQTRRTAFELVGSFLFSIAEMKAFDSALNAQSVTALRDLREEIETSFEQWGHRSFTRRGTRFYVDPTGTDTLILEAWGLESVVSAKIDGVALTSPELADLAVYEIGVVKRKSGLWGMWGGDSRGIEILVEHGPTTVHSKVKRAGLIYARNLVGAGLLDREDRATAVFTEGGEGYRITIAGRDGPTGYPSVDSVLAEFGHKPVRF